MRYKMTTFSKDKSYSCDEIIELEPLDCPASASECDKPKELSPYGDAKEWREKYFILKGIHEYYKERMVSIDDVLKVFDEAEDNYDGQEVFGYIRKAIEQMKRSE